MDKREMLKRYVELMVNVVKVEQPYMDLLGTDWYERENGLGSAYEKIFDFVEELIGFDKSQGDYGKSDMFYNYVYAAAKNKSECSLDEIVDILMLSEENFNKYYYGE